MKLHAPIIITPRLQAGLQIDGAFVSIDYANRPGDSGRVRYAYAVDLPDGTSHESEDLQSGCQGGTLQDGLVSLLAFLGAAGESYPDGENADLFPPAVAAWAAEHDDELSLMQYEIEESGAVLIDETA